MNEGIAIVEVENEEQLTNYLLFVSPEFKMKFVPVLEITKTFELYNKTKEAMKAELRWPTNEKETSFFPKLEKRLASFQLELIGCSLKPKGIGIL